MISGAKGGRKSEVEPMFYENESVALYLSGQNVELTWKTHRESRCEYAADCAKEGLLI